MKEKLDEDHFLKPYLILSKEDILEVIHGWEKMRDDLISEQVDTIERKRYINSLEYKINKLKLKIKWTEN